MMRSFRLGPVPPPMASPTQPSDVKRTGVIVVRRFDPMVAAPALLTSSGADQSTFPECVLNLISSAPHKTGNFRIGPVAFATLNVQVCDVLRAPLFHDRVVARLTPAIRIHGFSGGVPLDGHVKVAKGLCQLALGTHPLRWLSSRQRISLLAASRGAKRSAEDLTRGPVHRRSTEGARQRNARRILALHHDLLSPNRGVWPRSGVASTAGASCINYTPYQIRGAI